MRLTIWIIVGVVVVGLSLGLWMFMKGPDLSQYEALLSPRIIQKPDATVLEVPFNVNADKLGNVFGVLMKTYFKLSGVKKGPGMSAPVARYEHMLDLNMDESQRKQEFAKMIWKGSAAIAVPATVQTLPANTGTGDLVPRLSVWQYGEVAEILHQGAYEEEPATIKKLTDFITAQGYEICGLHEEEYLKGPGMMIPVKPKDYYTIIRYQVKKATAGKPTGSK